MRQMWIMIVIISFISVLSGSFLFVAYGSEHTAICLATRLNGAEAPCPESDPVGFANFHGSALRSFASLLVIDGSSLLLMIASLGIIIFGFLSAQSSAEKSVRSAIVSFMDSRAGNYPLPSVKLSWFSLHENSPARF